MHTDYYALLGVSRSATAEEIRAAYRRLARRLHPDVSREPAAEERFKEVTHAYHVLRNPDSRVRYELEAMERELELRSREFESIPPIGDGSVGARNGARAGAKAADEWERELPARTEPGQRGFFSRFVRRRSAAPAAEDGERAGDDYDIVAEISLEEAVRGGAVTLAFTVPDASGNSTPRGVERTIEVRVPKLVGAGERLKLKGEGGPGRSGGRNGDLNVEIAYKPHPLFRVRGDGEVWFYLPIAPWEAVLGAIVEMPTLEKPFRLHVPAGATSGQTFRLAGRGLPRASGGRGDLLACLRIVTPETPTEQERALYLQLARVSRFNPRRGFD